MRCRSLHTDGCGPDGEHWEPKKSVLSVKPMLRGFGGLGGKLKKMADQIDERDRKARQNLTRD